MNRELLRKLPKIDELLKTELVQDMMKSYSRTIVLDSLREAIDYYRDGILKDTINSVSVEEILDLSTKILQDKDKMHLRRVINATGTVIHTNLGRSILGKRL